MADYTPTTGMVCARYCDSTVRGETPDHHALNVPPEEHEKNHAEFDRWHSAEIRKAKAEALEEAADAMDADPEFRDPLRLKSDWLRNRAQQLKEES